MRVLTDRIYHKWFISLCELTVAGQAEIEASQAFVGQVLDAGQQAWSAVTNFFTPTTEETATLLSTNNTDSETVKLSASA